MSGSDTVFVPRATGHAFQVPAGQIFRIKQGPGGGQVGDLNLWNLHDPREEFLGSRTAQYQGLHLTTGDELYSTWPGERPMATIVGDTIGRRRSVRGLFAHDVLFGRCSRKSRIRRYGTDTPGCQEILEAAIAPFDLGPEYVHNAFNTFMFTGVDDNDQPIHDPSEALDTDYLELRAEIDCLVALSACPGRSSGPNATGLIVELLPAASSSSDA